MINLILAGNSIFGLNPALFAFLLVAIIFGGLNFLDFKRFD